MKKTHLTFVVTVCALIVVSSCNVGSNDTAPQQSQFLIANVSPDASPLSITINNSAFGTGLSYGIYTPYYSATPGSYTFTFTGQNATSPALTSTVNMDVNKGYSCFVIDSFSRLKTSFVEDNLVTTSPDSVYIRFFNFCPNAGPVTLYDSASKTNVYTNRIFNDEAQNSTYANFNRKKAGIYTLYLKRIDNTVLAREVDTLVGGHAYSLFAKGFDGGTGTQSPGLGHLIHY